jgi:hypothetical protein
MAVFRYAGWVGTDRRWTDEAVLRESERWVHIPQDGMCSEDDRRLLVHLPKRWGTSRVWRSWAADEGRASYLIEETIGEVRSFGLGMLVLHTGDRVAPPFMDECLARYRFQTTEKLEVLAYSLVDGREHRLPRVCVPEGVVAELVRFPEGLREALRVDAEVFRSPPPSGEEFTEYAGEVEKLRRPECGEPPGEGASLALRFADSVILDPTHGGDTSHRIIGAAGAQVVGGTLRLWGSATREAFRGRGAHRALVLERCRVGTHLGATLALTKANIATSASMLKRAGFRQFGIERRHVLEVR